MYLFEGYKIKTTRGEKREREREREFEGKWG
jgi:hypothetical protein